MTLVSDDPIIWPSANTWRISSYFIVAACAGVIYDWVLTCGEEIELVWRQRWSLMTVLYLNARYLGISFAVVQVLWNVPTIPVTDAGCLILFVVSEWLAIVVNAILGVIVLTRLHAMYQQSRKMLAFLAVIFLAVNIASGVLTAIITSNTPGEEFIVSGTYYQCISNFDRYTLYLASVTWILTVVWEVLALCLAVWIAAKHFRELRRRSSGGIIEDCFTVLIKFHVAYFASFVGVSCLHFISVAPTFIAVPNPMAYAFYNGLLGIFQVVQMFVLGPRLILSIREYQAKLMADSNAASGMTSIAFQERVHVSTSSSV